MKTKMMRSLKNYQKWGIEKIYPERKNVKIAQKNMPSENLDFIAFGLGHFVKANPVESMVKHIKNGLKVRINSASSTGTHGK